MAEISGREESSVAIITKIQRQRLCLLRVSRQDIQKEDPSPASDGELLLYTCYVATDTGLSNSDNYVKVASFLLL